jgi:nucleoside-diphosphate-sugar epimerase
MHVLNSVSTRNCKFVAGQPEILPLERLKKGTPAIMPAEDGYTNHIHADDLAQCVVATMLRGTANRVYHTVDDSQLKMGDYFDAVADAYNLPHPPRISRAAAQTALSPMLLSFMNESRRLSNIRMKQELKIRLVYPTVADALSRLGKINSSAAQQEMFPADSPPTR